MKIHLVFHVSLLEPYYASIILRKIPKQLPLMELNGEQKHKMEKKLNSIIANHYLQYLIHWQGYDVNE